LNTTLYNLYRDSADFIEEEPINYGRNVIHSRSNSLQKILDNPLLSAQISFLAKENNFGKTTSIVILPKKFPATTKAKANLSPGIAFKPTNSSFQYNPK